MEIFIVGVILGVILGYLLRIATKRERVDYCGSIKIAHDADGETYCALIVDPLKREFLEDSKIGFVTFKTVHYYSDGCKKNG